MEADANISSNSSNTLAEASHRYPPAAMIGATPLNAIANGLEPLLLGFEDILLSSLQEQMYSMGLADERHNVASLDFALDYACQWAFVTGHRIVFDARVGLTPAFGSTHFLINAVFFDFNLDDASDSGSSYTTVHTSAASAVGSES